MSPLTNNWR